MKNQQQVGVCWAFAISSVMDSEVRRLRTEHNVSPLHVVANLDWGDVVLNRAQHKAVTTDTLWPYQPHKACAYQDNPRDVCGASYGMTPASWQTDAGLRAELALADRVSRYRLDTVQQLQASPANLRELQTTLAEGRTIVAVFAFSRSAWSYGGITHGVFRDYTPDPQSSHAVAIVGYRTTLTGEEQFLLKNSWGTSWAHRGYAWMPAAMVKRHLQRAMLLNLTATPTTPTRPTWPTPCTLLPLLCPPAT